MQYPVIFGNEEGREQIGFTTCQKRASKNQYFYKTYTYKKTGKSFWQCNSTGYRISKKGMRTHLYVHQILTQTVRSQELKTYL